MKLNQIASNMAEAVFDRYTVLFSYSTPVAAYHANGGYFVTEQKFSQTTSKHINKWLHGNPAETVSQEFIESLVK